MTRTATKSTQLTQPEAIAYHAAIRALVRRAKQYAKKTKLTPAQVSKKLFGNQERITTLETGKSFLLPDTYDYACREMDRLEAALAERAA